MYMKPSKAGKNMWLRDRIANQNLKQNVQTQDVGDMRKVVCVLYDTVRGYISTLKLLKRGLRPPSHHACDEAPATAHAALQKKNFTLYLC